MQQYSLGVILMLSAALHLPGGAEAGDKSFLARMAEGPNKQAHKTKEKITLREKQKTPARVPKRATPEMREPAEPPLHQSRLTRKQRDIQDAFNECMSYSTEKDPVGGVIEFVFQKQFEREDDSFFARLGNLWKGSPEHLGHEVCLGMAFGLKGFEDRTEVNRVRGKKLLSFESPHVEVVGTEPLARAWVRDYLIELASTIDHGAKLRVTDLVRTKKEQQSYVHRGLSPADCKYNFLCSTHTTGSSVDLGLRNATAEQIDRLKERLVEDQRKKKIYFIRENSHYHVFVLPPKYIGENAP